MGHFSAYNPVFMSERLCQHNPERFKRILRTRGPERAKAYVQGRLGAMLRAESEAKSAHAEMQDAMSAINGINLVRDPQSDPIIWAGVYPKNVVLITPKARIIEPTVSGRQIGQGLSFA